MRLPRRVSAWGLVVVVVGSTVVGCKPAVEVEEPLAYVGREACASRHQKQDELWRGSHHDLAMQEAMEATVLGDFENASFTYAGLTSRPFRSGSDFYVQTDVPDGELAEFQIAYTFWRRASPAVPRGVFRWASLVAQHRLGYAPRGRRWRALVSSVPRRKRRPSRPPPLDSPIPELDFMCANCHSTNLRKYYRVESGVYEWSEIDVSCEACPRSRLTALSK